MAAKKTKTNGDGSVMPQVVELLEVVIQRQERTNEALGETNAALLVLAKQQDRTNEALGEMREEMKGLRGEVGGLRGELRTGLADVRAEVRALRDDIKSGMEPRVQRLEAAVFKTAAE
jgi:ABC-type transporter Mla subunit MlaD